MIIIYTTGVFDLLHIGHIKILKRARALGDKLTVGVQDDDSVEEQKGERPILNSNERMAMLEALHIVDNTICYTNTDQLDMLDLIKPNIMVQGSDWEESSFAESFSSFFSFEFVSSKSRLLINLTINWLNLFWFSMQLSNSFNLCFKFLSNKSFQ